MGNNKKSTVKNNFKQFPIKMKKGLKSQQSQPDNASPSKSASLASKCRTPRKNKSAEPTDANTCQRRSSPRFKEAAEPSNPKSTTQTPSSPQPETNQPTPYTRKKVVSKTKNVLTPTKSKEGNKTVKRKLDTSTDPCPNIQLRNPNDTFSDFEEEEDDEILQHNKDVQEEEFDVDSDEGKDNYDGDETGVEKELDNDDNGSDDKPEDEVVEPRKRRKFVPRGPTQMHAMRLDNTDPKAKVPFHFKEQPIGDPYV
ncbi:swi5-dependent recombination DNA repair protein 1 homolog [Papaver somniferum]|uniref:swi5-dependent recombination DNA repair protein 1 homolog n=1 Tax=Papaver somniferum TaxID=3469 RepID=UPI000E6F8DA3|nr:swi5-dependent recombination DNA repair protein 1 homolog [Papaver somniferum]